MSLILLYKLSINSENTTLLDIFLSIFKLFLFYYHFTYFSSKSIMPSKPKSLRKKYLDKIIRIILTFYKAGRLYA